jgi:alpha-glucosidase
VTSAAPWWRDAVIYEIYVRSFADGDGDGLGDLAGIRSRLWYLRDLGVDAIWLTPFYPSPQADGGYDVADHRDVDPRFGTMAGFDELVRDAHDHELRVIVDLVPNHTSDQHPWFRRALAGGSGSPDRELYLFRDGRGRNGARPPNNWVSVFGGPAWSRVTEDEANPRPGQWYLHLFAPQQPDLNWMREEVRTEFESILRFWLERGVDGFRIDVAHGLAKDPAMPDLAGEPSAWLTADGHPAWDQDEVHEVYRRWRRLVDRYPQRPVLVAEAWVHGADRLARYVRPDELHTAFNFDFLRAPWDAGALRTVIDDSIATLGRVGAVPTWVLSNHDVTRHVTRYGGGTRGVDRARAAALLMFSLPGGAYVYQGEELGLPEVTDLPAHVRQDPTFVRTGGVELGRDGCRVPMPWSGTAPPFGFGPSGNAWLPQPRGWAALTAERQASDPDSMLALYRDALRLRRRIVPRSDVPLEWVESGLDVLAFRRGPGFACVVNVGASTAPVPAAVQDAMSPVLATRPAVLADAIPGATAVWYQPSTDSRQ